MQGFKNGFERRRLCGVAESREVCELADLRTRESSRLTSDICLLRILTIVEVIRQWDSLIDFTLYKCIELF